MRQLFAISLVFTIFFTGTYWYYSNATICRYPISYRLGTFDERFELTPAEARVAIQDAASLWERATGKDLFIYDENAAFTINFIFDDRQAMTAEERALRDQLAQTQERSAEVAEQYGVLVAQFNQRMRDYQVSVDQYERELSRYNARVNQYNRSGGAPPEVVAELEVEQFRLQARAQELDEESRLLNILTEELNAVGQRGNRLVEQYNRAIETYNARFGGGRKFTQGEYRGNLINIFTFQNALELRQVLAHELGHALALEHVDDPRAIMYFLMGTQPKELTLAAADLEEFNRVCSEGVGLRGWLYQHINRL